MLVGKIVRRGKIWDAFPNLMRGTQSVFGPVLKQNNPKFSILLSRAKMSAKRRFGLNKQKQIPRSAYRGRTRRGPWELGTSTPSPHAVSKRDCCACGSGKA